MAQEDEEFEDEEFEEEEIGPYGTNGDNHEGLASHALRRLNEETAPEIDIEDYPELTELIQDLNDGATAYGSEFAQKLSVQPSLINKFLKFRGKVETHVARKLADRLKTYVRSEEVASVRASSHPAVPSAPVAPSPPDFVVAAVEWKVVRRTDEVEDKIAELVRLLNDVAQHIGTCNIPDDQRALSEVERAQLIAVLETVLHMLKAPMVEMGLLRKAGAMLKSAATKAFEKQVEEAFAFAAGVAVGKMSHLTGIL